MKIAVIGLGIIGGSIARSLKKYTHHTVDGWNRTESTAKAALALKYIDGIAEDVGEYDVVFVALPPESAMEYMDGANFKKGAVVSDICGVKKPIEDFIYSKPRPFRYVGTHPMAGKETRGIQSSEEDMFVGASMIITTTPRTDLNAKETIRELSLAMGFGRIIECDADYHDKKIALTSQLAHVVSNAYVKSPTVEGYEGFTGGSFQDMTRIAGVDENVWTQLYMMNAANLAEEIGTLVQNLNIYKNALENNDPETLKNALKEGRIIREKIKRPNN